MAKSKKKKSAPKRKKPAPKKKPAKKKALKKGKPVKKKEKPAKKKAKKAAPPVKVNKPAVQQAAPAAPFHPAPVVKKEKPAAEKGPRKKSFRMEFEIKCSPKILYNYISSHLALAEWFADNVILRDGVYTFVWDGNQNKAIQINKRDGHSVRFRWLNEPDYSYFEFEIVQDDLTSEVALVITDFASDEGREEAILLWQSQIGALKHVIGS